MALSITVLVENLPENPFLSGEHGLAFWVDLGDRRLLFDTGQTGLVVENGRRLGIDPRAADVILLSHGHYDHGGGLSAILMNAGRKPRIFLHPEALNPKFHWGESGSRNIGIPRPCLEALRGPDVDIAVGSTPVEVFPNVIFSGEIPRTHPEEATDEGFRLDSDGKRFDPLLDDQALFVRTQEGTVVLLGCAHAGLINTLDRISALTSSRKFLAVMGGMHLRSASDGRIAWTISELRRFDIGELRPAHCTGDRAVSALNAAFPGRCHGCGAGTTMMFKFS